MTVRAREADDVGAAAAGGKVLDAPRAAPDLDALSKLKEKNLAAEGLMILEGRIVIEKALDAGIVPRLLVCTKAEAEYWRAKQAAADHSAAGEGSGAASESHAPAAFPLKVLSHAELCALVDFKFHRGAIAVADMPRVEPFPVPARREAFYLCLWDVTDPSNLGALARTAAGLGADGVLVGPGCANPYYRKTIRASMGNVFSIPLWSIDVAGLAALAGVGARVAAAALTAHAVPPRAFAGDTHPHSPQILILGNEGYGLPDTVLGLCDDKVCIPMKRGVDSLNVAVAGGILMYELLSARE